jgi:uncharacterized protein YcgI (DUF1989 family)
MNRSLEEISNMAAADYSIGLTAHYKPLADFITARGYKFGIEIGTAYGGNSDYLMSNTDIHLICVDPYLYYSAMPGLASQEDYDTLHLFATTRLKIHKGLTLIRTTSVCFAPEVEGDSIDFVFLDGDHSYDAVLKECNIFYAKIRIGGALMGHDYNIFESVNKAVEQFASGNQLSIHQLPGNIWYINK